MRQLLILTLTDLRQRIRDKSVLIFAVVVPLALMFVFNLVFGSTDEVELEPLTVAVSAPAGDELAQVLTSVVRTLDGESGLDVTVREVDAAAGRQEVEDGDAAMALVIPRGFGQAAQAGEPVTVEAVRGDEAGVEATIVLAVVDGVLDQFAHDAATARAGLAEGVPPEQLAALAQRASSDGPAYSLTQGEASDEQLDPGAALVAGQTGLFLMFTVSFGVTGLLLERETGTLRRLRSMPMPAWRIVASKALVSFLLGVIASAVLLTVGGLLFDASFGSPLAVAALVMCVSAAATSVMFLIVRIARTSEQASVATSIVAVVLGVGGGAFFPVSAAGAFAPLLDLNPVAALSRGLGITASGGGLGDVGAPILVMLGFAAVMVLLSRLAPDRGALS
ncbi:ABC transporter permease [Nocardioides marmotae]|uniref:ABC transporter permease subunit n=1 Tax=Nocardioides marmotae TaxID=2663857 RepID=A0A6I3JC59_9ACTN|nr:ABC transporter permease [Nocardioides marmotae]MCR6032063.1 ABC transporter permease subunit [Gordonia jinghuaiqii]MBC9731992.1 ABC transporter permease [Nocardioides marmotae]MTB83113.1 ABC transporter permease subunit [Nocardioides marmotae]MTB95707.1 ABC transporter permease subunit [Nocardioides marmotae]QKE01110.1 ABC transporter permease [Nocardioides marmotae]